MNDMKVDYQIINPDQDKIILEQKQNKQKLILLTIILTLILLAIIFREQLFQTILIFPSWLEFHKKLGILLLVFVYAIATICLIPGLIITMSIGYTYFYVFKSITQSIILGYFTVLFGAMIGSFAAFLLGRFIFRDYVKDRIKAYKYMVALDRAIQKDGRKVLFLLRLCHVIPFSLTNYFMGVTSITYKDFFIGNFGISPGVITYVYLGTALQSLQDILTGKWSGGPLQIVLIIIGLLCAMGLVAYIAKLTQKYLKEQMDEDEAAQSLELKIL